MKVFPTELYRGKGSTEYPPQGAVILVTGGVRGGKAGFTRRSATALEGVNAGEPPCKPIPRAQNNTVLTGNSQSPLWPQKSYIP